MAISKQQIVFVFRKFLPNLEVLDIEEFTSGHINATYLIKTPGTGNFVLQRINSFVFKEAKALIENKVMLSEYLQELENSGVQLQFIRTPKGKAWIKDEENGYWNMSVYIEGSKTFSKITDASIAYEGGKLIGEFLNLTNGFDPSLLVEILPNFHKMSFRFEQFDRSLKNASNERLVLAQHQIRFANNYRDEMPNITVSVSIMQIPLLDASKSALDIFVSLCVTLGLILPSSLKLWRLCISSL